MELIFNLEQIKDAAKKMLVAVPNYKVFALQGEMGAGKTTFVYAVCTTG